MTRAPLVFNDPEASQQPAPAAPDLSVFKPRGAGQGAPAPVVQEAIDQATGYPSREAAAPAPEPVEGQINIRAPVEVIERFRRLCREDRRTYADMLRILMDERQDQADRCPQSRSRREPKP